MKGTLSETILRFSAGCDGQFTTTARDNARPVGIAINDESLNTSRHLQPAGTCPLRRENA